MKEEIQNSFLALRALAFRFYFMPRLIKSQIITPSRAQYIVELGCGSGHKLSVIENFASEQSKILGIEIDECRVQRAKRRVQRARIINDDIINLDDYVSNADVICMLKVAHQLKARDLQAVFQKSFDALNPGGFLVITNTFAPDDVDNSLKCATFKLAQKLYKNSPLGKGEYNNLPYSVMEKMLKEAGFNEVSVLANLGFGISKMLVVRKL